MGSSSNIDVVQQTFNASGTFAKTLIVHDSFRPHRSLATYGTWCGGGLSYPFDNTCAQRTRGWRVPPPHRSISAADDGPGSFLCALLRCPLPDAHLVES